MGNLADGLYKVISNEASNQLSQYQADKTISGEIFSIVDVTKGEYKVRYQDGVWSAFSRDKNKYQVGDKVSVKIPLGDFSATKYIEGYAFKTDGLIASDSNIAEEKFSPNWSIIYGTDWSKEYGLVAKASNPTAIFDGTKSSHNIFQQYANKGTQFRISADFMTTFVDIHTKGNYGLRLTFSTSKEDSPEIVYTLDTTLFNGDPYRTAYWTPQTILLTVPKQYLTGLRKIEFFQEGFDNYDPNNNTTNANIFCRNIEIEWVDVVDLTDTSYYLTIATPNGLIFTDSLPSLTLQAKLMSGKESLINKSSCSCYWYKENPSILVGSVNYEKVAGPGWERQFKDKFDTITISRDSCQGMITKFKVVIVYKKDVILSKEISLANINSQYDLFLELVNDTYLEIKNKKDASLDVKGLWYIELPDSTKKKLSETKTKNINLKDYFTYPWIKVFCEVYNNEEKITILDWTNYRNPEEEDLPNFILQYTGDDVFHYDANGDIYNVNEYDSLDHTLKCTIVSSQADKLTFSLKWLDSDKSPIGNTKQELKDSMMKDVWVDADNILHFKINTKFYNVLNKNSLYVRLTALDGTFIDYKKEINFLKDGDQGTNGTTYLCLIRPVDQNENKIADNVALRYINKKWTDDTVVFKAFIYHDGELINENKDFTISYTWESQNVRIIPYENVYNKIQIKGDGKKVKDRYSENGLKQGSDNINPQSPGKLVGFYIKVQVNIKYNQGTETSVYAYYPLDVYEGNDSGDISKIKYNIPNYIKYSASGANPQYDSSPLFFTYNGKEGEIISNSTKLNVYNKYLIPASHFTGENLSARMLKLKINEKKCLWHSIFMYLNPYGNEAINSWDGTTISIDNDKHTILAPQIGAGTKNDKNQFSGVVMGKDSVQNSTGLYGYQNGINTFALKENGEATFGSKQQITINGEKAQITGKNSGVDDGQYMTINLVNQGKDTKAIKIGERFSVDYDGTLTATSGEFTGKVTATSGEIGGCEIKDGKLQIAEANIFGKLTANVIDGSNLNVNSANIANSVNTEWVYAGGINANQISAGTLNADRINVGTLSWDKLIGQAPADKLSSKTSKLESIFVTKGFITNLSTSETSIGNTLTIGAANTKIDGGGITYKGTYMSWDDIVNTKKIAVFG